MCRDLWRGAVALLAFAAACPALAHNRSVSYSTWHEAGLTLEAEVQLPGVALNPLGLDPAAAQTPAAIAARVRDGFVPTAGGEPCAPAAFDGRRAGDAFIVAARWQCPSAPTAIRSRFLLDVVPGHLHLLQWQRRGTMLGPFALSAAQPDVHLRQSDAPAAQPAFDRYLQLGAVHILGGWDHLAFLLTLVLGALGVRPLLWRITGFTLGHSITLGLATLGAVRPSAMLVESMIALTIVCTAAERVLAGHARAIMHVASLTALLAAAGWATGMLPLAMIVAVPLLALGNVQGSSIDGLRTSLFGLFHGFGFAGVLAELNAQQAVPPLPLAGFNLGVELGQLLFVLPLWWLLRRWQALRSPVVPAIVLALGCGWYVQRIV